MRFIPFFKLALLKGLLVLSLYFGGDQKEDFTNHSSALSENDMEINFEEACPNHLEYSDSISVNFFLLDECRISQNISGEINYVRKQFDQAPFHFVSYFPNSSSTDEKIKRFLTNFKINIPYFTDYDKTKTRFYGATIAPEVVVYDEKNQQLLYRGRIDNSYDKVGSRRRVVTSRDLRNALNAILKQEEIKEKETQAIGCFI